MSDRSKLVGSIRSICTDTLDANSEFKAEQFEGSGNTVLNYRIHTPKEIKQQQTYPLFLVMHGAGERGKDNNKHIQKSFGPLEILAYARANKTEVIIIAPQVPEGQKWVNAPWDGRVHVMPTEPSQCMQLTIELIKQSINTLPVNRNRAYVTGISMGGFGAWDIIQRHPTLFAASMPICGGGDVKLAHTIKHIPIWNFHGDKDKTVPVKYSREMIAALKQSGGNPLYTEYKGVGHNSWEQTYTDPKVMQWLFEQKKIVLL